MGRSTLHLAAALVALLLPSCGTDPVGPGAIPASALPGRPGDVIELDATAVANGALGRADLEALLEEAGFVGGTERLFSRTHGGLRRALARVLVFEETGGAERYLSWLEEHAGELIGEADALEAPGVPGAEFLVVHEASACCPKAVPVYLAAWRRGDTVLTLEVRGQGVDEADVDEQVAALDAAV